MAGAGAGQQVRNGRWRTALAWAQAHHAQERSAASTWRPGGCSVTPPGSSAAAPAAIAGLHQRHVCGPARTWMSA